MPDIELIRRTAGERRAYMQGYVAALESTARKLNADAHVYRGLPSDHALASVARDICEQTLALAKMTEETP